MLDRFHYLSPIKNWIEEGLLKVRRDIQIKVFLEYYEAGNLEKQLLGWGREFTVMILVPGDFPRKMPFGMHTSGEDKDFKKTEQAITREIRAMHKLGYKGIVYTGYHD